MDSKINYPIKVTNIFDQNMLISLGEKIILGE